MAKILSVKKETKPIRPCAVPTCGVDIAHRRSDATTCSAACRSSVHLHRTTMNQLEEDEGMTIDIVKRENPQGWEYLNVASYALNYTNIRWVLLGLYASTKVGWNVRRYLFNEIEARRNSGRSADDIG